MSQKKSNISMDKGKPVSNVSSPSPVGKKLIQARLPFKTLVTSGKTGLDSPGSGDGRKRKLSPTSDDDRSFKVSRTSPTTKENIKATELTITATIDLLDDNSNDMVIGDDESGNVDKVTPKSGKKTKNSKEKNEHSQRRSSRKKDFQESSKVLIKIPSSAKKKKSDERQVKSKATLKIDEIEINEDDDDVIPIDSGENSLISMDDKDDKLADSTVKTEEKSNYLHDNDFKTAKGLKVEENPENDLSQIEKSQERETESSMASEITEKVVVPKASLTKLTDVKVDCTQENRNETDIITTSDSKDGVMEKLLPEKIEAVTDTVPEASLIEVDRAVQKRDDTNSSSDSDDNGVEMKDSENVESNTTTGSEECKTPVRKANAIGTLTPKQLQRKLESEKKLLAKQQAKEERERKLQEAKEERERKLQEAKDERERKLQEEKELRQKEREEKERQKKKERDDKEEQKRKEREDKEEQRKKEKDEREKKKQAEIDAKNEEKRQKDEEKRIKEEEKVAREEAELKKKRKEAEAFTKFFAKKKSKSTESDKMDVDEIETQLIFMPFRVKDDMRLAPIVRRKLSPTRKSALENLVLDGANECTDKDLYLQCLRNGHRASEKQGKTWPNEDTSDDVMIVDDLEGATAIEEASSVQKYRAKYLKFSENRRPPYYGTWQKKSTQITPRRPFETDSKFFDYEVDSDDEWEDEEPGESLHGSDDEKDKESDDDYDIDNEFFVPHGHLSDEEIANKDEIDDDNSPDTQKAKLKIMQKVFSDEMMQKTEKIKPRLIGLIWQNTDGTQPQGCPNVIWEMLQIRSMIFNGLSVLIPKTPCVIDDNSDDINDMRKNSAMKKRIKITEDVVVDLIRLIHGNTNNSAFLMKEFHAFMADKNKDNNKFQEFSLSSIKAKIKELAEWKPCPEEGPLLNKYCWYVTPEQRKHYNLETLSIINDWKYILPPKAKPALKVKDSEKVKNPPPEASDETITSNKTPKSKLGNIAKFAKVLSDDDKKKHFSIPPLPPPQVLPSTPSSIAKPQAESSPVPAKKRVKLLMSGPRGQDVPAETKNSLISQFLGTINKNKKPTDNDEPICID